MESELPWPNKTAVIATLLTWTAPNYTGNSSSLSYKVEDFWSRDIYLTKTPHLFVYLDDFVNEYLFLLSTVYNETSSSNQVEAAEFGVDSSCQFEGIQHCVDIRSYAYIIYRGCENTWDIPIPPSKFLLKSCHFIQHVHDACSKRQREISSIDTVTSPPPKKISCINP